MKQRQTLMLTHHYFAPLFNIENQRYSNGINTNITIETALKDQQTATQSSRYPVFIGNVNF